MGKRLHDYTLDGTYEVIAPRT